MDYHLKYIKYKTKYIELKKKIEGSGQHSKQLNELSAHFKELKKNISTI